MAATAEAVAMPFAQPGFGVPVEVVANGEASGQVPAVEWRDADAIDGLRLAREAAKEEAAQILRERLDQLCEDPETLEVPNPVDPLTTAGRAVDAKREFGALSPEYAEARTSLIHDSARLLGEAYRKNRWEYFAETRQRYNDQTGDYEFMGYSLTTMTRQGITPMAEEGEQVNRGIEYVEEATYKAVHGLGFLAVGKVAVLRPGQPKTPAAEAATANGPEARVMTITECPDWAIDAYSRKSKGGWGGYAPEVEKFMIRGVRFANDGDRYQEQLALSGKLITHDVIVEGLQRMRVADVGEELSKEDVRAKQLLNVNGQDVFSVAELLDTIASERSGKAVFLGEEVTADHPRDYAAARTEAAARQEGQQSDAEELADFLIMLEEEQTDHWVAQGIVENKVHKMVFQGVKGDAEAAAAAFDEKTAERIDQAQRLRANGNEQAARSVENEAEKEAPPVSFCGAGSCGLEDAGEGDEADEMRKKLKAEDDEELLRDTERSCPKCNKKSLWYSYNSHVVKTGCSSCGATNTKTTTNVGAAK
jgi:hypothetical protein